MGKGFCCQSHHVARGAADGDLHHVHAQDFSNLKGDRATGRKAVRLHLYSMLIGVTRSVAAPVLFWFLAAPAYWGLLWNHLHITGILVEMLAMGIGMSLGVFGCWLEVLQD
jgi:hypothetical protein